jgi:hypothetical protein
MDEKNDQTAHHRIAAGRGILRNHGRNNNSPATRVRIHDCRCSAAINLLAAGVDEGTVLKIGGWATTQNA